MFVQAFPCACADALKSQKSQREAPFRANFATLSRFVDPHVDDGKEPHPAANPTDWQGYGKARKSIPTLEESIASIRGICRVNAAIAARSVFGNRSCLAQQFLGAQPVRLVGSGGEYVPRGSGAQMIVLDVLQCGLVASGAGRICLGAVEKGRIGNCRNGDSPDWRGPGHPRAGWPGQPQLGARAP